MKHFTFNDILIVILGQVSSDNDLNSILAPLKKFKRLFWGLKCGAIACRYLWTALAFIVSRVLR